MTDSTISAYIDGKYYPNIARSELNALQSDSTISSGAAGFDRRRQYEDYAQDTVQPYNASGANIEFLRLYPEAAEKNFTPAELEQLKKQL